MDFRRWFARITDGLPANVIVAVGVALVPTIVGLLGSADIFLIVSVAVFAFIVTLAFLSPVLARFSAARAGLIRIDCYPQRGPVSRYVEAIVKAEHVFVLWNTGSILRDQGKLGEMMPHIDRLLLPHPDNNPTLESLTLVADEHPELAKLAQKIRAVTADVQAQGKEVRWWRGQTGNLLTIADEWIEVEQFTPFVWSGNRPTYRIDRRSAPDLYRHIRAAYDRMWHESEPPTRESG